VISYVVNLQQLFPSEFSREFAPSVGKLHLFALPTKNLDATKTRMLKLTMLTTGVCQIEPISQLRSVTCHMGSLGCLTAAGHLTF